jgi:aspartate racemase
MREGVVGIIGGMGPEATVDFMRRLVAATPAQDDRDHLHMLVDNNPKIPSRIAALIEGRGEDPAPVLCQMAQGLESQGADFLVMPCNTAHYYLPAIARSVRIPVLDMVALSIDRLRKAPREPRCIGMLASPAVRRVGLYRERMEQAGLQALFAEPDHEAELLDIIKAVKAGQWRDAHRQGYVKIAEHLADRGAKALLIACTELSVIGPPEGTSLPVIDTLDVLVDETLATARIKIS